MVFMRVQKYEKLFPFFRSSILIIEIKGYFCNGVYGTIMKDTIINYFKDKKIIILGFGKEGGATYSFIRSYFPELHLTVADGNEGLIVQEIEHDPHLTIITGKHYADNLNDYDVIMKSPGVSFAHLNYFIHPDKIHSQTSLFLEAFAKQTIGITGTKGKSTTASLIYHILKQSSCDVLLCGNIGVPFFDVIPQIKPDTIVVAELSAHQLEFTHASPHVAIFLNCFQEHLDHFESLSSYMLAKLNITAFQQEEDYLIYHADDLHISKMLLAHRIVRQFLPFSRETKLEDGAYSQGAHIMLMKQGVVQSDFVLGELANLPGQHNYYNVMSAILACKLFAIKEEAIYNALESYTGLAHRIELVGTFEGIKFYNDSIATVPEATIAAVKAVKKVDTLIVGGFDRGIDYTILIDYLAEIEIKNILFTGPAGERILDEWTKSGKTLPRTCQVESDFSEMVKFAFLHTEKGKCCLLSPAASSYNQFKNFEERGRVFKDEIMKYAQSLQ